MKALISFSVRRPYSVLPIVLGLVFLGAVCTAVIPIDFLPYISARTMLVTAEFPGISAREMRSLVTVPLEDAFASLKGLKSSSSVTRDGLSLLSLELHWGTDIDLALTEGREIITDRAMCPAVHFPYFSIHSRSFFTLLANDKYKLNSSISFYRFPVFHSGFSSE